MEFSRQEHWSGLPCPPAGDLPDPEDELESLSCIDWGFFTSGATREAPVIILNYNYSSFTDEEIKAKWG